MAKEAGLYKLIFESRQIAEEEGWKGLGVRHVWFDKYMESPRL